MDDREEGGYFDAAADERRREAPASIAIMLLTGGVAAAILGGAGAIGWAALMAAALIADSELFRRLAASGASMSPRLLIGLSVWAFAVSSFYTVLPIALWLHGGAAGAAAAIMMWVAGVVRNFGRDATRAWPIALAGAAPPALTLTVSPLLLGAMTTQPNWDLAVIAAVGGAALMAYVTQARLGAVRAEEALRAARANDGVSQTLAQMLFDHDDIAAALITREGRIAAMSRAMRQEMGLADPAGLKFDDLLQWSPELWRDAFARALAGEHVRREEDPAGLGAVQRWFSWDVRPWRGEDGAVCGVLLHGRDVTSIVAARTRAAESAELLTMALDASRSVVWEVDYASRSTIWHGDPKPVYGGPISFEDFTNNTTPVLHDEDRAALQQFFERAACGEVEYIEHRVKRGEGNFGWIEGWARPVFNQAGALQKFLVLSMDITERKSREADVIDAMRRGERALKAKRALFAELAPSTAEVPVGIEDRSVSMATMHERLDALIAEMDARDDVLAETMTSLLEARQAAEAASSSKSNYIASMSHELRTPLNAIIGYSEMLREEAEADGRDADMQDIDRVLAAARQLLHMINSLLDLSKIEAGRMEVSFAEADVATLIDSAVATVRPSMEKNGNEVRIEIEGGPIEIVSDPFKLNQCVLNLLANAAKFTENGLVLVQARQFTEGGEDWVEIVVSDTGIGMSEEQLRRLFSPFVQGGSATAQRFGGTGLGLTISRRIMHVLGGDVSVVSREGEGSTFTLRFPARMEEEAAQRRGEGAAAIDEGRNRTVLVIDDDESARDLISRSLQRLGFQVRAAASGAEGLELAGSLSPDMIVLDINLPDVSGWEVLSLLREDEFGSGHVPVLIHSVEDDRQRALSSGACEHLLKPANRDILAATVLRFANAERGARRDDGVNMLAKAG